MRVRKRLGVDASNHFEGGDEIFFFRREGDKTASYICPVITLAAGTASNAVVQNQVDFGKESYHLLAARILLMVPLAWILILAYCTLVFGIRSLVTEERMMVAYVLNCSGKSSEK